MEDSTSERSGSKVTLNPEFFDALWPLILEQNICDIHSKNLLDFYVAQPKFDVLWAHDLLAKNCYSNYTKPIEFSCSQPKPKKTCTKKNLKATPVQPDEVEHLHIPTLAEQASGPVQEDLYRKRLAYRFVNRKIPWYMEPPLYEIEFEITNELRTKFNDPLEFKVLEALRYFPCAFMIIDVAPEFDIEEMQRWIKFCRFVKMITIVRCELMSLRLHAIGKVFHQVHMCEHPKNKWHRELVRALEAGVKYAQKNDLYPKCGQPFCFVFAHQEGMCGCDTFQILRKF